MNHSDIKDFVTQNVSTLNGVGSITKKILKRSSFFFKTSLYKINTEIIIVR